MQLEKELISLDPHSFERMEEYLACFKEIQLNLSEFKEKVKKKDGQLIDLVLINLRTPFDMFVSTFRTNLHTREKYGKDYSFEFFCEFFYY
jgi:hypothetical protein